MKPGDKTSSEAKLCPDCGAVLSPEAWGEGLCLACALRLAAPTPPSTAVSAREAPTQGAEVEGTAAPTLAGEAGSYAATVAPGAGAGEVETEFSFSPGQVLGQRYRVLKQLGRGGMGEVWRAYDLKLRMDVALKTLLMTVAGGEQGLELLRSEVRAAREVISPNVCRLFDIIEIDGQELVSMEYIDGETLKGLLEERGPLELQEAGEIGSQFLAGLEAIHQAGLVHRDIKPENIMLTRSGRVVIMDFGLTAPSGTGVLAGTPAYMPPEQGRGEGTDARADVFSAGMVLAEMLSAVHGPEDTSRRTFWEDVRKNPPQLPDTAWTRVLLPAVASDREDRYESAAALARKLEEVAFRVEGAEDKTPYPGLEAYSEDAAEFFFGREAEVEALWKKLQQSHLLAVVGASGSGKSSFINAGLLPARPASWAHLQLKPGPAPFAALGRSLLEALGEADALGNLSTLEDPEATFDALCAWRSLHPEALLIVDQFEELFTQNEPGVQRAFADLLSRVALDGDVHVLISMRDDFLLRCHALTSLAPMFSELTLLQPPVGSALRRALTQPALRCGYRFEEEGMVEEMLTEVTRERGALPLIAFTAAQLWEQRDRDEGLLTRAAYDEMGGVGGALAQHAEAMLEGIGRERSPIVRELFRNLVTAQGTRAVMEVEEVLSVFDENHEDAAEVLQSLVDARLLTAYEVKTADDGVPQRRVEIVHESLLSAWPRLVRWRTQDAEGAQLRDELRQAARLWETRGRSVDLLWTGTAFREFQLWRERYPGRLTALEESFAAATVEHAERVRRRKRNVLAAVVVVLLGVVAGMTTLWRQSEVARGRAEAQKLVALGQLELESFSTASLAWATKSLELADSEEARLLALRALWKGPPASRLVQENGNTAVFSPTGEYLFQALSDRPNQPLINLIDSNGTVTLLDQQHQGTAAIGDWASDDIFVTMDPTAGPEAHVVVWSASERRALGETYFPQAGERSGWGWDWFYWNDPLQTVLVQMVNGDLIAAPIAPNSSARVLGNLGSSWSVSWDGTWVGKLEGSLVTVLAVTEDGLSAERPLGNHAGATSLTALGNSRRLATRDDSGEIRVWDVAAGALVKSVEGPVGAGWLARFDRSGSLLSVRLEAEGRGMHDLWVLDIDRGNLRSLGIQGLNDLSILDPVGMQAALPSREGVVKWGRLLAPDGTDAIDLQNGRRGSIHAITIHPSGGWIASPFSGVHLWPLGNRYPMHTDLTSWAAFHPSGDSISLISSDLTQVFRWPLDEFFSEPQQMIYEGDPIHRQVWSHDGSRLLASTRRGSPGPVLIGPERDAPVLLPDGFESFASGLAFSPDDRYVAASGGQLDAEENFARVWDLETLELIATFDPEEKLEEGIGFTQDNEVLVATAKGVVRWDFESDRTTPVFSSRVLTLATSADETRVLVSLRHEEGGVTLSMVNLETGEETPLTTHRRVVRFALGLRGEVVASRDNEGVVRVGRTDNSEPHLMFSPEGGPDSVAIDPLGRWVLSGGTFWPMPDLDQPPLHTLPLDELIGKLHSLTNFRIVPDPESATGWKLDAVPFPGWETVPTW